MFTNPGILGIPSAICFLLDLTSDSGNMHYRHQPLGGSL